MSLRPPFSACFRQLRVARNLIQAPHVLDYVSARVDFNRSAASHPLCRLVFSDLVRPSLLGLVLPALVYEHVEHLPVQGVHGALGVPLDCNYLSVGIGELCAVNHAVLVVAVDDPAFSQPPNRLVVEAVPAHLRVGGDHAR